MNENYLLYHTKITEDEKKGYLSVSLRDNKIHVIVSEYDVNGDLQTVYDVYFLYPNRKTPEFKKFNNTQLQTELRLGYWSCQMLWYVKHGYKLDVSLKLGYSK